MKTLTLTRKALYETKEAYDQACKVTPGETDNREDVLKFKYACGKNANRLRALLNETGAEVQRLHYSLPEYAAFMQECTDAAEEMADRDDNGQPVVDADGDFVITKRKEEFEGSLEWLRKKHAAAIEAQKAVAAKIDEYLEQTVDVKLHQVSFVSLPEKIGGAYVDLIGEMLTDKPEMEE